MKREDPSGLRLGCATLNAIFVPLLGVVVLIGSSTGEPLSVLAAIPFVFILGFPIAAAHVFALWLPAWIWISRHARIGWLQAAALGLVCGALPSLLLSGAEPATTAVFGGSGLVGGLAFWLTLAWERT